MRLFWCMVLVILAGGCTEPVSKAPIDATNSSDCTVFRIADGQKNCVSKEALWLQDCVSKIPYNGQESDVRFMPKVKAAEEIFSQCEKVEPLAADKRALYKKWLESRVQEIQSIAPGTTRKQLKSILYENGGLSTAYGAIYSHVECQVLKVRIEFDPVSKAALPSNDDDKVKAVSMPYLGFFIAD